MNVSEVARALGIGVSAVRKAIARGTMTAVLAPGKHGKQYMVEPQEVHRYRREHLTPRKAATA